MKQFHTLLLLLFSPHRSDYISHLVYTMQIIDKETPALFNEINIYEFTLLKKAIFNKTRGKSLKEYEKVADSISDSIKMSDITEFTRNAFKIALKALDGDKKAEACYKDISKIIDHYFGYDKFGF